MSPDLETPLGREQVVQAAARLRGKVWRTPVVRCPALDELAGAELWLKAECLQRIGAFKARGAMHAVSRLPPEVRARGVVTYSSGNHAQAVALAAREHEAPASVAMPVDAPAVKVAAVRALGAAIVFAGTTSADRRRAALAMQAETGAALVEPFDDADVIAGQGTATLELLEQVAAAGAGPLDALLVPVGGGGLIAGACLACDGTGVAIHGVEPVGCDSLGRSLAEGSRAVIEPAKTIADGLRPVQVGALNFAVARERVAGCMVADDDAIGAALVGLLLSAKLLVEPSGAAALAAALSGRVPGAPRRIGVLLSGGNVAPEVLASLLARHAGEVLGRA